MQRCNKVARVASGDIAQSGWVLRWALGRESSRGHPQTPGGSPAELPAVGICGDRWTPSTVGGKRVGGTLGRWVLASASRRISGWRGPAPFTDSSDALNQCFEA